MTRETTPLGLIGHLLQTTIMPRLIYLTYRSKHRKTVKIRRQRKMSLKKEQKKIPERDLNKMEAEFKILVIRMFSEYRGGRD